jgi:hypothetical protein
VQARRSSESTIAVETFMNNAGWIHQTDELVMAIEGDLELKFQGRRFHPAIGEEVLIPARVRHTVSNVGKTTARWLYGDKELPPHPGAQTMEIR